MTTNINPNSMSSESQCAKIKDWLESGHTLTSIEALQMFGCFRLASRIHDLRDRGVNINKTMIYGRNGKRYAQYSIGI
jgi:hypothetical protein